MIRRKSTQDYDLALVTCLDHDEKSVSGRYLWFLVNQTKSFDINFHQFRGWVAKDDLVIVRTPYWDVDTVFRIVGVVDGFPIGEEIMNCKVDEGDLKAIEQPF